MIVKVLEKECLKKILSTEENVANLRLVGREGDVDLLERPNPLGSHGVAEFLEPFLGTHWRSVKRCKLVER